jgi:hypothetical protein
MMSRKLSAKKRIELARELWGWMPHPTQREWMLDEHPVKVAACGRRWGKTESASVDVATYAIAHDGCVQMIVSPTYDQSRILSDAVERLFMRNSHLRRYVQVTKTPYPSVRFMRSRITARTADDDGRNLRGHSADRVIVDEAAFVRDQVLEEVIGPMLADKNGRLVMISTPFGKNHFYRAFVRGQRTASDDAANRVRSFRFPSWANPHISREYIEAQSETITARQFRVEYEAEFVNDESSVFAWEDIHAAIDPHSATTGGVCVAGIDWARYSDYTAVVVLEVNPPTKGDGDRCPMCRVVAVDRFNRMDWRGQVDRVADLLGRHRVRAVAADQTSVGDPVLEMLRDVLWNERRLDMEVEGVVFTSQTKRELIDNLAVRLAHGDVVFPNVEPLVQELQFYEYELTEAGNVRTAARRGYHDDCVCALALALRVAPRYRFTPGGFLASGRTHDYVQRSTAW